MDKFFGISERNSTVRAEIIGGLTTFFAMAYIVFVNPNQVAAEGATGWLAELGADSAALGQIWNAVYIASILAAVIGTLMMALYAKLPFAQACGMGLNAFFCTCFVSGAFFAGEDVITGYHSGMVIIFLAGIVFLILSVTGARQYIAKSMPECLKKSIPAGIGLFIAFIGLQNAGVIQANQYTLVQFVDIHGGEWKTIAPALTALIGILVIAILGKYKVKGNIILGIIISTVVYYVFMGTVPNMDMSHIGRSFKDFGDIGVTGLFGAEAWKAAFSSKHIGSVFNAIVLIITFCLVDMFDTIGTLYGTSAQAGMIDENGDPINVNQAMTSDSVATVAGSVLGTSTCTTFVESAAGVAAGARTGLASVVTAACFVVCLFLTPLASIIPSAATAPALIYVGVLMLKNFSLVDMDDLRSAVPAFLTLFMMPMTYSIANGIGIGAIAYVIISLFTGNYRKKDIMVTIIAVLFAAKFVLVTM
ncbi:MAG: NCS2 family permease [Lachnospiraceae bacterium]|jgi:AGZA family xanthine/uracil permease-like MFS transporter|nr:NCS2 family permease [Lachnospiraceae bacterium]